MPTYCYKCEKGHPTEEYHPYSQTPSAITCFCGLRAPRDYESEMRTIVPILPRHFTPHYNPAFGERVESEAHLRHLQKTRGTCDMGADDFGAPPTHFDSNGYSEPKTEGAAWVPREESHDTFDDSDQPFEIVRTGL